ncbi:MAG: NYN domain-containing protein, partial [Dehalococcoidales bacterium]|nr:NYN domain-containing protein [Dehalococcoidales bacterium]
MLTHAYSDNYDTALLVAGDSDYVYALQAVKNAGKHVEITLFGKEGTSALLRKVADKVVPIDGRLLRGVWKQPANAQQNNK